MKRANLIRGFITLVIAVFFGYRYWRLDSPIYLFFIILFAGIGLASLINRLASRWQNLALNVGVSLVFLDLVFAEINLVEIGTALGSANYWLLVPSMLLVLTHLFFRTLRSQALLKPMGDVSFWPAFRALVIGITGNAVLPARAGEFLRAYVLGRSTGLPATGVFANVVVERVLDGLTVLLVLLAAIILGVRDQNLQQAGIAGAALYVGVLVALIIFMTRRRWADMLIHKFLPSGLAEFSLKILDGFSSGLAILKSPGQLGLVLLWNIFTWIPIPLSFWLALSAFDFGTAIPWQTSVLMLPAMALALTIPGAPAGIGLVQFAAKYTTETTMAGLVEAEHLAATAAAASIVIHLSQFAPEVVAGVISFLVEGLSTRDISAGRSIAEVAIE